MTLNRRSFLRSPLTLPIVSILTGLTLGTSISILIYHLLGP